MKIKTLILYILVLTIVSLVLGISYASFSISSSSNPNSIVSGSITTTYTDGIYLLCENMFPVLASEKNDYSTNYSFSVKNNSQKPSTIKISLTDLVMDSELKSIVVKYELYDSTLLVNSGNFLGATTSLLIANNIRLESNMTKNYKLLIYILDDGSNQNNLMKKTLSSKVYVTSTATN